jgi:two-component system, chemotaxis family, CheB/CheR fusion protein
MSAAESVEFEDLVDYLKTSRSFDFRAYKKPTLARRIQRRMMTVGVATFGEYREYLEEHPDEFIQLFNTVLINVTNFFRDEAAWQFISEQVVPKLLEEKRRFDPIRVWSAGCASGEEAYTLAMVLAEALGMEAFRSRVKIYATDIDENALAAARQGIYESKQVESVPAALLERYFDKTNGSYSFNRDLRRSVIFGKHDLLQDAPISRVDLLACRNTLMYFNAPAQARILARLHFALTEGGYLFLGRAETLLAHSATFRPVDLKQRVFAKVAGPRFTPQLYLVTSSPNADSSGADQMQDEDVRDAALNVTGVAQLVIARSGELLFANDLARSLFGISAREIGKQFHDLELSYRPLELRSLIEQAYLEHRPIAVGGVEHRQGPNDTQWLDAQVIPLTRKTGEVSGVSVVFTDVTVTRRLQQAVERANVELASAHEQLQSAGEEMQTTNEELQSTVEELETTNEELQASNEELETMNEELQSTNDELHTVNDLAQTYTRDLDTLNQFLESIFYGLGHRVIVVGRGLNVTLWNKGAEELWGVSAAEAINSAIGSIDFGLPVDELSSSIQAILGGSEMRIEKDVLATNRRGKKIDCHVTLAPLLAKDQKSVAGVIILTDAGK